MKPILTLTIHNSNKEAFERMLNEKCDSISNQVDFYEVKEQPGNSTTYKIHFTDQLAIWQTAYSWAKINETPKGNENRNATN